jgi:hydrogenase-4 component E
MIKFLPQLINLFATLILMLSFAMISQRRIVSLINLFTLQGAALVATSLTSTFRRDSPWCSRWC